MRVHSNTSLPVVCQPATIGSPQLSELCGWTPQHVNRRLRVAGIKPIGGAKSGRRSGYCLAEVCAAKTLPLSVRLRLAKEFSPSAAATEDSATPATDTGMRASPAETDAPRELGAAAGSSLAHLPQWARERAEPRLEILVALRGFSRDRQISESAAIEAFIAAYNDGAIAVSTDTREREARLFPATLKRWRSRFAREGAAGLAGRYCHRRGKGLIDCDTALQAVIFGMIAKSPQLIRVRRIFNLIRARHAAGEIQAVPSYPSLSGWLRRWQRDHAAELAALANPDRARGHFRFAVGVAAPDVVRPCQIWAFDNTSLEVLLLVNGQRQRWYVTTSIDYYSRRARVVLTRAPGAAATLACQRRMMRDLGPAPGVFVVNEIGQHDRGSEFENRRVQTADADLGIESTANLPHRPWQNPYIESFNKTLLHGLMEQLPGYCGHNVSEAQAIRSRKTLAQRLAVKSRDRDLVAFSINLSPEEVQRASDRWLEVVYEHTPHRGLGGRTPAEVWNSYDGRAGAIRTISDERKLDVLLTEIAGHNGLRVIGKQGLLIGGYAFADSALAGLAGQRVYVRCDPSDIDRVWVFSEDRTQFLCVAKNLDLMDTASRNDVARVLTSLQSMRTGAFRKRMNAHARGVRNSLVEVMSFYEKNAPTIRALNATEEHSTPAMVAAAIAADAAEAERRPVEPHHDPELLAEGQRLIELDESRRAERSVDDDDVEASWQEYLKRQASVLRRTA